MKRLALRALRGCGIFSLARTMSAGMARILMYHNFAATEEEYPEAVVISAVRKQLSYLSAHFRVIPLTQLVEQLRSDKSIEKGTVVLTVDDGRRNFWQFFFPLLKEFRMPATFFVVSSFICGKEWIWTDKVLWLARLPHRPQELQRDKLELFFGEMNRLRPDVRTSHIDEIAAKMKISIPKEPPAEYAPCSWAQLREMADSGLVEIGSHSVTHPIFSTLTDEETRWELTHSRSEIERLMGRRVSCFCFPNGRRADYFPKHLQQVKETGYLSAVMTHFGMPHRGADEYALPRIGVTGKTDFLSFMKYVDGVEYYQGLLR
jgi:peptidoglycan/xylan/chitin deacetylase (PgdA/CDA1 family)